MSRSKNNGLKLLWYLALMCTFQNVLCYTIANNVLQDLTSTDANFFTEAVGWTASSLIDSSTIVSMCNDTFLLGGYNILGPAGSNTYNHYFQRVYTGLPSHNTIYFEFSFWVIDGWNINFYEYFWISFDNNQQNGWAFRYDQVVQPNQCGSSERAEIPGIKIQGQIPHNPTSLTFKITSALYGASDTRSFGFRDIKFTFDTLMTPPTTTTICARSPTVLPDSRKCTCTAGQYEQPSGSGTCLACDSSCATCSGGASNNCLSCGDGKYLNSNQCYSCDTSCKTCNGAGPSACASCNSGRYLSSNQCLTCSSSCTTCNINGCTSCPTGKYLSGNQCIACDSSCATCFGGSANQCLTCPSNRFMVNNNTCASNCDFPLIQTTNGVDKFCESPCSASNKFLYWDGSCESDCSSPLSQISVYNFKLCNFTCGSGGYLLYNGTCDTKCATPLQIGLIKNRNLCEHPCSTQYLFWNGTCSSTCPFKAVEISGKKFCNYVCNSTQYLIWNQTCVAQCLAPMQIKIDGEVRYCNFPCDPTQYSYWNGTCSSVACSYPLTQRTEGGSYPRKFCDLNCSSTEYMYWYGNCSSTCPAPLRVYDFNGRLACKAPCDSSLPYYFEDLSACGKTCTSPRAINNQGLYPKCAPAAPVDQGGSLGYFLLNAPTAKEYTIVVTGKAMKYIQFLSTQLPSRLEKLGSSQGKSILSPRFGIPVPSSFYSSSRRLLLPDVFINSGLDSKFIVNFWDTLITMAILLLIAVILIILEKILRKTNYTTVYGIIERMMVMATVNYFLLVFASSIGEIIIYSYIEFSTSSSFDGSLFLSIIMIILIFPFLIGIILLVKKASSAGGYTLNSESIDTYKRFAIKWRSLQVLIRGIKSETISQKLFFLIYTIRVNIPMLISIILATIPIAQTLIQLLINGLTIGYLIKKRPLQKMVNFVQILLLETITFLLNFCLFIIVIVNSPDSNISSVLADMVIIGSDIMSLLLLVFLAIKLKLEFDAIRKFRMQYPNHNKSIWINLLGVLAQQTGMGFEEVIEESSIPDPANKYISKLLKAQSIVKEQPEFTKIKSRVYPSDFKGKSFNETDPILKGPETSNTKPIADHYENSSGTSMVVTNGDISYNNTSKSNQSPKLKARVKNVMNSLASKKKGPTIPQLEKATNPFALSPTFSIDLDTSPTNDNIFLMKKDNNAEQGNLSPLSNNETVMFPDGNKTEAKIENRNIINVTPIEMTDTSKKNSTHVNDIDSYLQQFSILKGITVSNKDNLSSKKTLSRSPTLKAKQK